jgi:hypothetical protein
VVEAILSRLAASGILIRLTASLGGIEVFNTRYMNINEGNEFNRNIANFVGYGFPCVMDAYEASTLQIVVHGPEKLESGTAFATQANSLMTAAHCLKEARAIQIIGFKKSDVTGSRIFLARREATDCAMIFLPADLMKGRQMPLWQHAEALEEVILLGYPNIPTLLSVQLAEKANVSTILRGGVAREVADIFNVELLLVTAPVRGGFSGGPVINSSGLVVGMVSRQPFTQLDQAEIQRYDAAGFGLAIPTKTLLDFTSGINANDRSIFEERDQSSFEWLDG